MLFLSSIRKKNYSNINVVSLNELDFVISSCCFDKFFIIMSLQKEKGSDKGQKLSNKT